MTRSTLERRFGCKTIQVRHCTLPIALFLAACAPLGLDSFDPKVDEEDEGVQPYQLAAQTDTSTDMDTPISIYDIQIGDVAEGSFVTLTGVIATSSLTDSGDGFFIQDEAAASLGGAWTGIYVYIDELAVAPSPGDKGTVSGTVAEYYDLTEIAASEVLMGPDTAAPYTATLTSVPADWEVFEGALVTLTDVRVTSSASWDSYGRSMTNWGIAIDDIFYAHEISEGTHIDRLTGVIDYSWDSFNISPRGPDDIH